MYNVLWQTTTYRQNIKNNLLHIWLSDEQTHFIYTCISTPLFTKHKILIIQYNNFLFQKHDSQLVLLLYKQYMYLN